MLKSGPTTSGAEVTEEAVGADASDDEVVSFVCLPAALLGSVDAGEAASSEVASVAAVKDAAEESEGRDFFSGAESPSGCDTGAEDSFAAGAGDDTRDRLTDVDNDDDGDSTAAGLRLPVARSVASEATETEVESLLFLLGR